jgi:hypothetical protein
MTTRRSFTARSGGRAAARRAHPRTTHPAIVLALGTAVIVAAAGCAGPLRFPAEPLQASPNSPSPTASYDIDGDGRADYVTVAGPDGRIARIGYVTGGEEPETFVDLDSLHPRACRHLVLIVDGIGYETVKAYRDAGRLRLFHEPAPVVSTFPAMTDIALADIFESVRPLGYEARYFDHAKNRLVGGDAEYLSMLNEDWVRCTDYRAGTLVDPLAYLFPHYYFREELKALLNLIQRRDRPMVVAYLVSTAGLGTKHLRQGQEDVLEAVDRLAHQLVWESRGLVKVTVLSDHGHQLVPAKWIDFRTFLRQRGWRVTERLDKEEDAVVIDYGLVTYASFATRRGEALGRTLLEHEGVDVVTYVTDGAVAVASDEGAARIERQDGRFRYVQETGDPLHLAPVIAAAKADGRLDADGFADDRTWLVLTHDHLYPDPLVRMWRAFHGLTEHVPDVIASLADGYSAGLPSRAARYPDGASTHGDLARKSTVAFVMSTSGAAPAAARPLRCRDLPEVLPSLLGRPWPPARKE